MTTVERILVPVDFSPSSEAALIFAAAMAERFFSEIDVLHVFVSRPPRQQMTDLLERFGERGVLLRGMLRLSSDTARTILDVAASGNYDLIALGRGHFVGAVTQAILARAVCPVVMLRSPAAALRLVSAPLH